MKTEVCGRTEVTVFILMLKKFSWLYPHNHHVSFDVSLCSFCYLAHGCLYHLMISLKKLCFDFFWSICAHFSEGSTSLWEQHGICKAYIESLLNEDNDVSFKRFFLQQKHPAQS